MVRLKVKKKIVFELGEINFNSTMVRLKVEIKGKDRRK